MSLDLLLEVDELGQRVLSRRTDRPLQRGVHADGGREDRGILRVDCRAQSGARVHEPSRELGPYDPCLEGIRGRQQFLERRPELVDHAIDPRLDEHTGPACHRRLRGDPERGIQRLALGEAIYSVKKDAEQVNPLVFDGHKLLPSVTRVFGRGRELFVFLEAYQRAETSAQPVIAFVTLYRGETKALETAPLAVTAEPDARSKGVPLRFSVPLDQVPPGRYDCQVTVLLPGASKATFWRAPIVVVP